jgi:hypothetical protein
LVNLRLINAGCGYSLCRRYSTELESTLCLLLAKEAKHNINDVLSQLLLQDPVLHKCPYCNFSSPLKSSMTRHIESVHDKITDFKCPHCDYSSSQKANVSRHIKQIHDQVLDQKCPDCNYITALKFNLDAHIQAVHFGIKSRKCNLCGFATAWQSSLVNHKKIRHPQIQRSEIVLTQPTCYPYSPLGCQSPPFM